MAVAGSTRAGWLVFSAMTLVVMFAVLVTIERLLALVSLSIVPLLFLRVRWAARRLRPRAERTQAPESRLSARPAGRVTTSGRQYLTGTGSRSAYDAARL